MENTNVINQLTENSEILKNQVQDTIVDVVDNTIENVEMTRFKYYNFVGNSCVTDVQSAMAQTPKNDVYWSGDRGRSKCYPNDKRLQKSMEKKYGQSYVQYDKTGEPNFTPFAEASVKISDMGNNRSKNFASAGRNLLETDWAKENKIYSLADLDRYMKKNNLTWHECKDCVTMQLIPTKVNSFFGHLGGVSESTAATNLSLVDSVKSDGVVRTVRKVGAKAKIDTNKGVVATQKSIQNIQKYIPDNIINIGNDFSAGALEAISLDGAGIPVLVEGATNAIQVLTGEKGAKEAATDVAKITSVVAVSGGTTRAVTNAATDLLQHSGNKALQKIAASNQVAQIVGISMMLKDSFIDWVNGEIDGDEFLNQVNEKAIGLAANYAGLELATVIVGSGGAALIPALVAMVVSTACVEIYKSIQNAKLRSELSEREWNRKYHALERLALEAMVELHQQKGQLKNMMDQQFADWDKSFETGFQKIFDAIQIEGNTSEAIADGLQDILGVFDKDVAFRTQKEFDEALMDENFVFVL